MTRAKSGAWPADPALTDRRLTEATLVARGDSARTATHRMGDRMPADAQITNRIEKLESELQTLHRDEGRVRGIRTTTPSGRRRFASSSTVSGICFVSVALSGTPVEILTTPQTPRQNARASRRLSQKGESD